MDLEKFNFQRNTPIISDFQKFITYILLSSKLSTTISKIKKTIYDELGEKYSMYLINNYLKKLCNITPIKHDKDIKISQSWDKLAKGLFWTEVLWMINKQLLFYIDKWCFTREVKVKYSWLPFYRSSFILNDVWKRYTSLIMRAGSTKQWFGVIKQETIDYPTFWIFWACLRGSY